MIEKFLVLVSFREAKFFVIFFCQKSQFRFKFRFKFRFRFRFRLLTTFVGPNERVDWTSHKLVNVLFKCKLAKKSRGVFYIENVTSKIINRKCNIEIRVKVRLFDSSSKIYFLQQTIFTTKSTSTSFFTLYFPWNHRREKHSVLFFKNGTPSILKAPPSQNTSDFKSCFILRL